MSTLADIPYANNVYRGRVRAAHGYLSGQRISNLKTAEKELRKLLWEHRDAISDLIRDHVA